MEVREVADTREDLLDPLLLAIASASPAALNPATLPW
jgi:hypothetical protein